MCPPKVYYPSELQYREHFYRTYCCGPIYTHDGIPVHFRKRDFTHCMYESTRRDGTKDLFSNERSERIDWIKATLESPTASLYQGWDKDRKSYDNSRRVAVVYEEFVVVIVVRKDANGNYTADFHTAFLADNSIGKIRASPKWEAK